MPRLPLPTLLLLFVGAAAFGCGACSVDAEPPDAGASRPVSAPAAAEPPSASRAATQSGPKVVFLGDSLTAGLHVDAREAYPAVLQRRLTAEGLPFELVNAGVSGDTTAGGLRRLDWLLKQGPDALVVALGGNDGLRGTPLETVEENLRAIVTRVQAAGAEVLLLGMRLPPNYGPAYTDGFQAVYERVAREAEVEFVPFYIDGVGGVPELNHPDGIHPLPEGHERIADNLEPALRALVDGL